MAIHSLICRLSLVVSVICYLFISNVNASTEPGNAKIFRLQYAGHASYIIGTVHDLPVFEDNELKNMLEMILKNKRLVFENRFWDHISLSYITSNSSADFEAAKAARDMLDDELLLFTGQQNAVVEFFRDLFTLSPEELGKKYGKIEVTPSLHQLAEEVFGSSIAMDRLIDDAMAYNVNFRKKKILSRGIDNYLYDWLQIQSKDKRPEVSSLEKYEPFASEFEKYVRLIDYKTYNRKRKSESVVEAFRVHNHVFSHLVRRYLMDIVHREYLTMENSRYLDLILRIQNENFGMVKIPGREKIDHFEYRRHDYWIAPIMKHLRIGSAVIAVGLSHVIGENEEHNSSGGRVESILNILRKKGVVVTPLDGCYVHLVGH